MAVKKCCVENCNSSSTRSEDIGVTYHKFPKHRTLREQWVNVTRTINTDHSNYVCSRHFCKSDFQIYQDSKYVLKSDAVPSIFSWKMADKTMESLTENNSAADNENNVKLRSPSYRKESESENVEAIKKFIEEQEREIQERERETRESKAKEMAEREQAKDLIEKMEVLEQGDPMVIATSVMDMILSESEAKIANKNIKPLTKQSLSPKDKVTGNSMALSVGSKVEAKDFGEYWYPAEIVEVDYDEMEVLVHYTSVTNKHDEWISVSSPRLRPMTNLSPTPSTSAIQDPTPTQAGGISDTLKEEVKQEEKSKLEFIVGERCLARWRDNRRFIATVITDLGNGQFEVIFDDGFVWKCSKSRLYKLKSSSGRNSECLSVDTSMSPTASTPSPTLSGIGPSAGSPIPNVNYPVFHNHLFDPTRDYLGSKSERREMKRKLNIKEIFNIGQKKQRKNLNSPKEKEKVQRERKPKVVKSKIKSETVVVPKIEIKKEIPDAVASIIGTVASEEVDKPVTSDEKVDIVKAESPKTAENNETEKLEETKGEQEIDNENKEESVDISTVDKNSDLVVSSDLGLETCPYVEPVPEEEVKLENFEKPDNSKQEVIEKMKVVINKLEDGLNQMDAKVDSPKPEAKNEIITETTKPVSEVDTKVDTTKDKVKKLSKIKKNKKLRLLQEKKVKKQVEKVKSELEEMKRQVEEMRKQMLFKTEELPTRPSEMPESFLLPGEWCCKWVDGQPVGNVSEIEAETSLDSSSKIPLPRRSVQVEDKRLPPGWSKHMVRRSLGQSAGKWDVVLVGPDNRRFHTKTDMRNYLEHNLDESLKPYESALLDFGVHLKLSRRMGWVTSAEGVPPGSPVLPSGKKRKKTSHKRKDEKKDRKRKKQKISLKSEPGTSGLSSWDTIEPVTDASFETPALEDGYVYVGSLKVQIIENLLRCPAEGCFKNFRNNTLIQMHIKHYHRDLREMLGATPKVLDLARERTKPTDIELPKPRHEPDYKIIKVKLPRLPKRLEEPKVDVKPKIEEPAPELRIDIPQAAPSKLDSPIPRSQDSPKLRQALAHKPVKRPKVLLPVRRPDPEPVVEPEPEVPLDYDDSTMETDFERPVDCLDFEAEISTHTVSKPFDEIRKKIDKKRKCFSTISKRPISEDDEWFGANSDMETRSSFPGSGTPDSKTMDKVISYQQAVSSESNNEDHKDTKMYMYTETGERIKIEHMKREEIINCHCGFREEDGLMVQCELCLCWQHALCHNIQKESEVPEKYTCSICLNPRRGRRSKRFLHDQDRLYEGLLPGAKPCENLRRSHELSGNLLRIQDALHALRVKYYVATKKDHPKLYLWAKDWENTEETVTQERLNSDYSDLNIIINNIGKENLPVKPEEVKDGHLDVRTPIIEEPDQERLSQNSNSLLNLTTALSSPSGGPSLDLPITTSELERLAKSVQEQEAQKNIIVPQPEAAIENSVCRERLLHHVQRCQALIDARLDSIEAQVAELESQDPSFEDDETADFFPRTKQTIQMLMRDLDTMEELGMIT